MLLALVVAKSVQNFGALFGDGRLGGWTRDALEPVGVVALVLVVMVILLQVNEH